MPCYHYTFAIFDVVCIFLKLIKFYKMLTLKRKLLNHTFSSYAFLKSGLFYAYLTFWSGNYIRLVWHEKFLLNPGWLLVITIMPQ